MLTWTHETTIKTKATAKQIWQLWSKPEEWNKWDDGIEWVKLEGSFVAGTQGFLKPVGAGKVKFLMLDVQPEKGFKDRSFLPLTTMDFIHIYTPASSLNEDASITHRVEMRGWLTPLFSRVIGKDIQKTLPDTLAKLSSLAEKI